MKVPITKPIFDEAESKAVAESLKSGWVVQGPRVYFVMYSLEMSMGKYFFICAG